MSTGDHQATIVDLLDHILDRGAYIKADIILTVAGIPLLGLSLHALLGGVETLLAYGVFRDWDTAIRSQQRESPVEAALETPVALFSPLATGPSGWIRGTLSLTAEELTVHDTAGKPCLNLPLCDVRHVVVYRGQPGSSETTGRVLLQGVHESVWVHVYHLRSFVSALVARGVHTSTTTG